MPELAKFQADFAGRLRAAGDGAVNEDPSMAIYRNTWRKALVDTLEANFPAVAKIVGGHAFRALALEFIHAGGSASPILANFGAGFPAFLRRHSVLAAVPYLADVACVERLSTEAHHAADAAPMPLAEFVEQAEQSVNSSIRLHPAVRFCWLDTPALTIWQAHQHPDFSPFAPEWRAEGALINRPRAEVTIEPLGKGAFVLLENIRSGASFGRSVERAGDAEPAMDIPAVLVRLAAAGTFLPFQTTED